MANGFLDASPSVRHGNSAGSASNGYAAAQRFTVPGSSGTVEISEIGAWLSADSAQTGIFHLAIFSDDSANANPDVIVSNSESGELTVTGTSIQKISFTFPTKPVVNAGGVYWIAIQPGNAYVNYDLLATGGTQVYYNKGYATWPTAANWDSASANAEDQGLYAVYVAAVTNTDRTPTIGSLSAAGVASRNDRGIFTPTEVDV